MAQATVELDAMDDNLVPAESRTARSKYTIAMRVAGLIACAQCMENHTGLRARETMLKLQLPDDQLD